MDERIYLFVTAHFTQDGMMFPDEIHWPDGRSFPVDRVLDIRPAAARKAGGQGDRYTVRIKGCERYLFFERDPHDNSPILGRWFIEKSTNDLSKNA